MSQGYVVRYGKIPARSIYNYSCPSEQRIADINESHNFFNKLEESILKDGIQNPICVVAGKTDCVVPSPNFPQYMLDDPKKCVVANSAGGSRLWVAAKHDLDVPCMISDWLECFPEFPELKLMRDIRPYFQFLPEKMVFAPGGLWVKHLPHIHLGDKTWQDRLQHTV